MNSIVVYTELERYGDGDRLLQMTVSPQARKKNPALPTHWQVRAVTYEVAGKEKTVFTPARGRFSSAAQVATLYHERWEIELGYRGISKSAMQHNAITLRSKKVDFGLSGLGLLLGYNLVRRGGQPGR